MKLHFLFCVLTIFLGFWADARPTLVAREELLLALRYFIDFQNTISFVIVRRDSDGRLRWPVSACEIKVPSGPVPETAENYCWWHKFKAKLTFLKRNENDRHSFSVELTPNPDKVSRVTPAHFKIMTRNFREDNVAVAELPGNSVARSEKGAPVKEQTKPYPPR